MSRTLRPTIRSSMWSTIPTPCASADLGRALDQLDEPEPLAVDRDRAAAPRSRPARARARPGASLGPGDELEDVVGRRLRRGPRSSAPPRSGPRGCRRSSTGGGLVRALDRDPVLARVGDLLLAAHLPLAHRRQHLELGVEGGDRAVDPHLVVALAGAAVGDRVAAGRARVLDRELRDQRPGERGEQRVAAAVERVRPDRRQHVVARRTPRARRRGSPPPRPSSRALPTTTSQSSPGWPRSTVRVTISAP